VRYLRQINANKSKEKPRKKAWISLDSFGRIRPFQWVTANPNKKIFSLFRALRERCPVWARASVPVCGNRYSTDAGYLKEIAPKIQLPTAAPSRPFAKDSVTRPPRSSRTSQRGFMCDATRRRRFTATTSDRRFARIRASKQSTRRPGTKARIVAFSRHDPTCGGGSNQRSFR
jgi:hypothetical protein